jgi:hypothetical protein
VSRSTARSLFPLAAVATPNLPEASALLGGRRINSVAAMRDAARDLHALGPRAVLVKGGHLPAGAAGAAPASPGAADSARLCRPSARAPACAPGRPSRPESMRPDPGGARVASARASAGPRMQCAAGARHPMVHCTHELHELHELLERKAALSSRLRQARATAWPWTCFSTGARSPSCARRAWTRPTRTAPAAR